MREPNCGRLVSADQALVLHGQLHLQAAAYLNADWRPVTALNHTHIKPQAASLCIACSLCLDGGMQQAHSAGGFIGVGGGA